MTHDRQTPYPTLLRLANILQERGLLIKMHNIDDLAAATVITGADCDSRVACEHHVFVCKGAAFRPAYLIAAKDAGAVAYLCEPTMAETLAKACPGMPAIVTSNIRPAMAWLSAYAWGHPDRDVNVLGITGTKGKTTAAYMLRAILNAESDIPRTGILGSVDTYDGMESFESVNTTPEAPDLWRHLTNVRDAHLGSMVMEVSSQALKYDRVTDLRLRVGCFLNIGRDHISAIEHPDFEDYLASKLRIFRHSDIAVVNIDTDFRERVLATASQCQQVITTSASGNPDADIRATALTSENGTVSFDVTSRRGTRKMSVSMPGFFNVDNALVAIAVAELLGIGDNQIMAGLGHVRVPGRMELLQTPNPSVTALVDYAHNVLSYQKFFSSVTREFPGRRVIALFGAPGDKAKERRRDLPIEAARWADLLIYTEEDPAHENVADICKEMAANTPDGCAFKVITDRPEAIAFAAKEAFSSPNGALVCLLAKGDETRQHRGDEFVPCETDGDIFMREARRYV